MELYACPPFSDLVTFREGCVSRNCRNCRRIDFEGAKLQSAIFETLQRRGTPYKKDGFKRIASLANDEDMPKRWKNFLKTIKDNMPEFPFVIEEIQIFLEPVFDAMVNAKEFQKMWLKESQHWI